MNVEIFAQGSFANDTKVRLYRDIDINVSLSDIDNSSFNR